MIVLDTHALVWWVAQPERVPPATRRLIDSRLESKEQLLVSTISVWEVAMLVTRGRLKLTIDLQTWLSHLEALPFLQFVPVDNQVAVRAVLLDNFPTRDPADRMIVATAMLHGATLVTADRRLRSYRAVNSTWTR